MRSARPAESPLTPGVPYKPLWWLRRDLDGGASRRPAALAELARRVDRGRLSDADLNPLLDRALAEQAATARPWVPAWGALIEAAHARQQVSPERWRAYAAGALGARLVVRPVVRQGDPLPLAFAIDGGRVGNAEFTALFELRDGRLDGRPIGPADPGRHQGKASANARGCGWSSRVPTADGSAALPVGPHTLTGTFRLTLYDGSTTDYSFDESAGDPPGGLGVVDWPAAAAFAVVDAARAPLVVVVDQSKRAAVERAVTVRPIRRRPNGGLAVNVQWTNVPVRLIYRIVIRRPDGSEVIVPGTESLSPMAGTSGYDEHLPAEAVGSAAGVDVIFRPDVDAARRDTNPAPIWGGEVVVRGVPVVRE